MRHIRRALKLALPYGIVRAYQTARELDALKAQVEAERAAEAQCRIELEEKERKLFAENEIVYGSKRVFAFSDVPNAMLNIGGSGNFVSLHDSTGPGRIHITMQDCVRDCRVAIGKSNTFNGNLHTTFYYGGGRAPRESSVEIGDHNIVNGNLIIVGGIQPGTAVSIGSENLFADNINLIGAVDHLVYNVKTKEKYSDELGVSIKDRVWICRDALLLNGAHVNSNSIVGARSVVNKAFEDSNVLIAGIPARVTKRDVMWHLNTTDDYLDDPSPLKV